ncbi:MipA/OmpV family protein [Klebsiella aerogenes]|uniref:MipA/OmpV family protein n=1 Tax=Klebsiella aerogenes TaxID=548 RepID=UPI0037B617D8
MTICRLILATTVAFTLFSHDACAEADPGSIDIFSSNNPESPVPKGFISGGGAISGQARYQAQDNKTWVIPGAFYFGDQFMYLGDRARYYFHVDDKFALYGYGRYRFSNLDPGDAEPLHGMNKRKGEFEAGMGITFITPYALLSARMASDITGRSNGQELLLWTDFPIIRGQLLVMPGFGMMIRSDKMANYYFGGVSSSEASPGRKAWDTGTTVSPMAAVIASYRFSAHWVGMFAANYELYDNDIADSPIVQHQGEWYTITGVGYTW